MENAMYVMLNIFERENPRDDRWLRGDRRYNGSDSLVCAPWLLFYHQPQRSVPPGPNCMALFTVLCASNATGYFQNISKQMFFAYGDPQVQFLFPILFHRNCLLQNKSNLCANYSLNLKDNYLLNMI